MEREHSASRASARFSIRKGSTVGNIALPPKPPKPPPTETDITICSIAAINRIPGVRAARNNVGTLRDARGIPVTYGLGDGSPDIVGVITFGGPESASMRLRAFLPIALAFGLEMKRPRELGGRGPERNQRAWHHVARRRGFDVGVARSEGAAVRFVQELIEAYAERLTRLRDA